MRPRGHLRLLLIASAAWLLFWLAGLPDYYRQHSTLTMVIFDLVILPPIWLVVYRSIRKAKAGRAPVVSLWWAFYLTVPLFILDLLYCGVYLGHGLAFIWDYWYLTVYYFIPWLIFPPTGRWVETHRQAKASITT